MNPNTINNNRCNTSNVITPRSLETGQPGSPHVGIHQQAGTVSIGMQSAPQIADPHYTRLMRLLNTPEISPDIQECIDAASKISNPGLQKKAWFAIAQHSQFSSQDRFAMVEGIQDLSQKMSVLSKMIKGSLKIEPGMCSQALESLRTILCDPSLASKISAALLNKINSALYTLATDSTLKEGQIALKAAMTIAHDPELKMKALQHIAQNEHLDESTRNQALKYHNVKIEKKLRNQIDQSVQEKDYDQKNTLIGKCYQLAQLILDPEKQKKAFFNIFDTFFVNNFQAIPQLLQGIGTVSAEVKDGVFEKIAIAEGISPGKLWMFVEARRFLASKISNPAKQKAIYLKLANDASMGIHCRLDIIRNKLNEDERQLSCQNIALDQSLGNYDLRLEAAKFLKKGPRQQEALLKLCQLQTSDMKLQLEAYRLLEDNNKPKGYLEKIIESTINKLKINEFFELDLTQEDFLVPIEDSSNIDFFEWLSKEIQLDIVSTKAKKVILLAFAKDMNSLLGFECFHVPSTKKKPALERLKTLFDSFYHSTTDTSLQKQMLYTILSHNHCSSDMCHIVLPIAMGTNRICDDDIQDLIKEVITHHPCTEHMCREVLAYSWKLDTLSADIKGRLITAIVSQTSLSEAFRRNIVNEYVSDAIHREDLFFIIDNPDAQRGAKTKVAPSSDVA